MKKLFLFLFVFISSNLFGQGKFLDDVDSLWAYGSYYSSHNRRDLAIRDYVKAIAQLNSKKEIRNDRYWSLGLLIVMNAKELYGDSVALLYEETLLSNLNYKETIDGNKGLYSVLSLASVHNFETHNYDKAIYYGEWFIKQIEDTKPLDIKDYTSQCLQVYRYYKMAPKSLEDSYNFLIGCKNKLFQLLNSCSFDFDDEIVQIDIECKHYAKAIHELDSLYAIYIERIKDDSTLVERLVRNRIKASQLLEQLGMNNESYDCLSNILKMEHTDAFGRLLVEVYYYLGLVSMQLEKYDEAIQYYRKSIECSGIPGSLDVFSSCYTQLAFCYDEKNDVASAYECAKKAYDYENVDSRRQYLPFVFAKVIYFYYKSLCGNYSDLEELLNYGDEINIPNQNQSVLDLFTILSSKACLKYRDVNGLVLKRMIKYQINDIYSKLIQVNENFRYQSIVSNSHLNHIIFNMHSNEYECNNDLLYNLCLAYKGASLNSVRRIAEFVENSTDKNLKVSFDNVQRLKLLLSKSLMNNVEQSDSISDILFKEENLFIQKMLEVNEHYLGFVEWTEIKKKLKKDEISVEFFEYKKCDENQQYDEFDTYGALVIKKNVKQPIYMELFQDTIFGGLEKVKPYSLLSSSKSILLYKTIWEQILKECNGIKRIYFSPSGLLNVIPIENLCISDGVSISTRFDMRRVLTTRNILKKESEFNLDSVLLFGDIAYTLSDEQMIEQSRKFANYSDNVSRAFWDDSTRAEFRPIPGTKTEVDNIDKELSSKCIDVKKQTGSLASEEAFKVLSTKGYDIIHLATHGFFLKDSASIKRNTLVGKLDETTVSRNPLLRSGLALAGANRAWKGERIPNGVDDGILTAQEIKDLELSKTQMVVLSACETGLGDINTDGVFGLQRAFKSAGVQTIVMSLWKVSDNATSLLMTEFYKGIISTGDRHKAFLQAKEAVRARFPEAYYWAGWVMLD